MQRSTTTTTTTTSNDERTFLVAVDFSDCSRNAVRWMLNTLRPTADDRVVLLAVVAKPDASLPPSVLRAFDQTEAEAQTERQLKQLWAFLESEFNSGKFRVECDDPKLKIVEIVNEEQPSMLVVGNHGKTGTLRDLGSVSDYCLRHCIVPVVVVQDPTHRQQLEAIHRTNSNRNVAI